MRSECQVRVPKGVGDVAKKYQMAYDIECVVQSLVIMKKNSGGRTPPTSPPKWRSGTLGYKIGSIFQSNSIAHGNYYLDLDVFKLLASIRDIKKIGLNGQILINLAKVIFGYGNPYIFLNVIIYLILSH